jgi:hypothetical protein
MAAESGSGRLVRLGCGCRGELAAAHRRCAEAWFSVRGNRYSLPSNSDQPRSISLYIEES